MHTQEELIQYIAGQLEAAQRVLFITGAGVSADSGLPTYRGIGGLYNRKVTEDNISIEEALSKTIFDLRPDLTWKYLLQIEESCRSASYNRAHEVISRLERHKPDIWVLTQNIDGFHRAAGSENLIEIHGHLLDVYCTACDYQDLLPDFSDLTLPPLCPSCGGTLRPNVVLFGETLNPQHLGVLYRELAQGFDMVFSIGTTSAFPYISMPVLTARHQQVPTVEINPGETQISDLVDYKLDMGAAEALDALWDALPYKNA